MRSLTSMGAKTETSKKNGLAALCSSMLNVTMFGGRGGDVSYGISSLCVLFGLFLLCRTNKLVGVASYAQAVSLDDGGTKRRRCAQSTQL